MALGLLGWILHSGSVNLVSNTHQVSDATSPNFFFIIYQKKKKSPRVVVKIKRENKCKMLSPVPGMWKSTVNISWLSCPSLLAIHLSIKTAQETQHKLSQTRTISEFGYYPLRSEMVQV